MNRMEVEVLSDLVNHVIVRWPGRQFPGMVLQGDSLRGLLRLSERILNAVESENLSDDLKDDAEDLRDRLKERVELYESVIGQHGFEAPYPDRASGESPQS